MDGPRHCRGPFAIVRRKTSGNDFVTDHSPIKAPVPFQIRPMEKRDLDVIAEIYGEAVRHGTGSFEIEPPSAIEMASRYQALVDGGFPYFVAEMGGEVKGFCYAGPYRPRPAYRKTVEDSVYVAVDARGKGMGEALLSRLIEETERSGFRQMLAVIGDSANAASINLHRKLGFTFVGTVHAVGYKHGEWLDVVTMQKSLGAGDRQPP
ncbi:phosphinothricin N-acetyltransferase [bacterium MnTg02]|nr:phosphinothricin N-acetyltransferase [bacterium MnTg02]